MDGASEVKIMGEVVPVRCKKAVIPGYSAHADQPRLLNWLRPMRENLKKVYLVHGEAESSEALARTIEDEFAVHAEPARIGESVEL